MSLSPSLKYRHELKYLVSYPDYTMLKMRTQRIMKLDRNVSSDGYYTVRSLYFDDYLNSAYIEKLNGVPSRRKYRIRIYNFSDDVIHLECKNKRNRYVRKETAPLSRLEYERIINGDITWMIRSKYELHRAFYHEYQSNLLRPRVVVDYEREPFTMAAGDVRVTFDKNIRAGMERMDIFNSDMSTANVLKPGYLVMEVKYTSFLPELVRQILTSGVSGYLAISKFLLCCEQTKIQQRQ